MKGGTGGVPDLPNETVKSLQRWCLTPGRRVGGYGAGTRTRAGTGHDEESKQGNESESEENSRLRNVGSCESRSRRDESLRSGSWVRPNAPGESQGYLR